MSPAGSVLFALAGASARSRLLSLQPKSLLALLLLLSAVVGAQAQFGAEAITARSRSAQFVVRASRFARAVPQQLSTNRSCLLLEPTIAAVSCERVKALLLRQLRAADAWRGKVFVTLYPAQTANDGISLRAEYFRDGWQYEISVPDVVDRVTYVKAMTQILLLEIANRGAAERSAELPLWLVEGFSEELLASGELQMALSKPQDFANGLALSASFVDGVRDNPLERAHRKLLDRTPLTFEQLSWPAENEFKAGQEDIYRGSAHLFVHSLFALNDGAECFRSALAVMPRFLNWQFALLEGFKPHFARVLDVEKWWALEAAHFQGRDLNHTWTAEESWNRFEETLASRMQTQTETNGLRVWSSLSLQQIIQDWQPDVQDEFLNRKLQDLNALRLRLHVDLVPLVDEYRSVIEVFIQKRTRSGFVLFSRKASLLRQAKAEAVARLDVLDSNRNALRSKPAAVPTTAKN